MRSTSWRNPPPASRPRGGRPVAASPTGATTPRLQPGAGSTPRGSASAWPAPAANTTADDRNACAAALNSPAPSRPVGAVHQPATARRRPETSRALTQYPGTSDRQMVVDAENCHAVNKQPTCPSGRPVRARRRPPARGIDADRLAVTPVCAARGPSRPRCTRIGPLGQPVSAPSRYYSPAQETCETVPDLSCTDLSPTDGHAGRSEGRSPCRAFQSKAAAWRTRHVPTRRVLKACGHIVEPGNPTGGFSCAAENERLMGGAPHGAGILPPADWSARTGVAVHSGGESQACALAGFSHAAGTPRNRPDPRARRR